MMNLHIFLAVLLTLAPTIAQPAIFDDGNDRKLIKDLRAKDPAILTDEEKAILAAANKVGAIGLCNGTLGGNAFFIKHNGKPAVVTHAHLLVELRTGRLNCDSGDKFAGGAIYMPNSSFYDAQRPQEDRSFVFREVAVIFPPLNWEVLLKGGIRAEEDFAVFYLSEDIGGDPMPDGSARGHLEFSNSQPTEGNLYMLGVAGDLGGAVEMVYQARCDGFARYGTFYHSCDALKGSSGSLLATFEQGQLKFRGLQAAGMEKTLSAEYKSGIEANIASSSDEVGRLMEGNGSMARADLIAYEVQWLLSRTSCYSGKLDNQWGPGSRKALAAFATAANVTLPGTEPSAELLAAVEKAAPEGTEVCRR